MGSCGYFVSGLIKSRPENLYLNNAFSPYTAIMGRPWLHTLGVVSSTLHQQVKYPSRDQVLEILGSRSMARQCLVVAIQHWPEVETSATAENDL